MAKPIFIITVPHQAVIDDVNYFKNIATSLEEDYHVILVGGNDLEFKMFSDKEIEPIQLEELKKIVSGA